MAHCVFCVCKKGMEHFEDFLTVFCVIVREFCVFGLDAAQVVSGTTVQVRPGSAAKVHKSQTVSSGQKFHQPIAFSFADIMQKVRTNSMFIT